MAYNSKNHLRKIVEVQEITLNHSKFGVTQEYVYKHYIYPVYHISRSTYYAYLRRNAKRELKKV